MVQVYTEPLCRRHYARWYGEAVIFRLFILGVTIALSLVVAFATGGFWTKLKPSVAQATVHYTYDALLLFEGGTPGSEMVWSTSQSINTQFALNYVPATVQIGEEDLNFDGKPDVITFTATVTGPSAVRGVKALLQFQYRLQDAPLNLRMYSFAYLSYSSPFQGSQLFTDGELLLQQRNVLTDGRYNDEYNTPMLMSDSPSVTTAVQPSVELEFQQILSSYLSRNYTTLYTNHYPVWKAGSSNTFQLSMRIRIPPNQVVYYRPMIIEMLKAGWIQFLATYVVLWWLLSWAEQLIFRYRVVTTRVTSDLQPRAQKF